MSASFDQVWDVAKFLLLTVLWPVGRWIVDRVTGKRKRRLDAIDELTKLANDQAVKIAKLYARVDELLDRIADLALTESQLRMEIAQLRAEIQQLRAGQ